MKAPARTPRRRSERGVALVLAIFTLMLISVIATALILMAGTASAIKANYRTSMQAFYDAKAGLEEGRGRLWSGSPAPLGNCVFPTPGSPMPTNQVCYITNPDAAAGETVIDPTNSSDPYADFEYDNEFGLGSLSAATVSKVNSNSPLSSPNIAGPLYKWVRITPRTEKSAGINVDGSTPATDINPLYFDGSQQLVWTGVGKAPNASQVLTITALAMTANGGFSGRRLLQYTVAQNPNANTLGQMLTSGSTAPPSASQIFPAALTLDGNGVSYTGQPQNGSFTINGNDSSVPSSGVAAIGYTNSSDSSRIAAQPASSYQSPSGIPSVEAVSLPTAMQTPNGLDALVQDITLVANVVITPPKGSAADQTSLPSSMSAANPVVAVVNGDFNLYGYGTGYGLLVVTGNLDYDPDASWKGIILVIGKGVFTSSKDGTGALEGALLIANTRDRSTGNLLASLGPASYSQTGGGSGIRYNSSWVNQTQALLSVPYQVLSFREIQQLQ